MSAVPVSGHSSAGRRVNVEKIRFTDEQRALIETDGPTYVSACPGAGKTQAIVERFITRPATHDRRRGIALVSFTNAAVEAAKSRCIGAPGLLESPNFVGTIDSFINRFVIAPVYATRTKHPAIFHDTWSSVSGTRISVQGIQGSFELSWFNLSLTGEASLNIGSIPYAQRSAATNLTVQQTEALQQKALATWRRQINHGVFDAATARQLMSHYIGTPEVGAQLQDLMSARFAEVIVDECQDCSKEDVLLLELLHGAGVRLILVGDPDQGIYGFRGGSASELDSIRKELSDGKRLNGNFRSSPAICAVVDSLRSSLAKDKPLGPHAGVQEPIHVVPFRHTKEIAAQASSILNTFGVPDYEAIVLAHVRATARAGAGAGSEPAERNSRLVRLAYAVHVAVTEGTSLPAARARALDQVGRILRELGSAEDQALTQDEFLVKHNLTTWSHRYACLQVAMGACDPYSAPPKQFRERLVALKSLQQTLAWSPKTLQTPTGNKWPGIPRPSGTQLQFSTIHGFKGLQAPAVVLVIPDAGGPDDGATSWVEGRENDARRVLYVGASRAQRLMVLAVHERMVDQVTAVLTRDAVPFVVDQAEPCNVK